MNRLAPRFLLVALFAVVAPEASAQLAVCTHEWSNASGGDWNTAANWTPAAVPASGDDACIILNGTYTVTANSGADIDVNTLTVGGASGTQTLDTSREIALASGGTITANGVMEWSSGFLTGGNTLTNNGLVVLDGQNFDTRGVSGAGTVFANAATVRWEREEFVLAEEGVFENTGTIEAVVQVAAQVKGGGATYGLFDNRGTITVTSADALTRYMEINAPSRHEDAVFYTTATGELYFSDRDHTFAGTTTGDPDGLVRILLTPGASEYGVIAEAGATWDMGGEGMSWALGILKSGTLTNDGLVVLDGQNFDTRGVRGTGAVFSNAGTVRWEREEFVLGDDGEFENTGLIEAVLDVSGDMLNIGATDGFFDNSGTISVTSSDATVRYLEIEVPARHENAVFTATATGELYLSQRDHTFAGTTTGAPDGLVRMYVNPTASEYGIIAEPGATWDMDGTGMSWEVGFLKSGTLTNDGLVVLDGQTFNTRGVRGTGAVFSNAGTVRWEREEFVLGDDGEFENTGLIEAVLDVSGDMLNIGATDGFFDNSGTISVTSSDATVRYLEIEVPARHENAVFTATATGEIYLSRRDQTFAGTTTGAPDGLVRMNVDPTASGYGIIAEPGATWDMGGAGMSWAVGFLTSGTLTNTGVVVLDGINFNTRGLRTGTTFENTGTVNWSREEFTMDGTSAWNNGGTLRTIAGGTSLKPLRTNTGGAPSFNNSGTVSADDGTLDVNIPFDHQAGALISGAGVFDISGSAFTHTGDTSPGASPGILTWAGQPWAPASGATFTAEIAGPTLGTNYDQLNVNGAAALTGTLEIDVTSTSGLTVGDEFTILTASGGVTGTFTQVSVGGIPGASFSVAYNANNVVVTLDGLSSPLTIVGTDGWRTLSTPFPDLPIGGRDNYGMLQDIYTAGYLGADRDQRNNRGTANVYLYDESTGLFAPPADAGPLAQGVGIWVYTYNDDDSYTPGTQGGYPKPLLSSGTPSVFPVTLPVTYTPSLPRNASIPALGFNLVGNPANFDLNWDDPNWTKTNISDVLYIWDHKFNGGDWRTWNGTTGTLPNGGLIPVGQGFHVEATGANPELVAPASAVLTTQSPLYRVRETAPAPEADKLTEGKGGASGDKSAAMPLVRLRLDAALNDEPREAEVFVSFSEAGALGFDKADARLLSGRTGSDAVRLYAELGEAHGMEAGTALQIATVPEAWEGVLQIPIGAEALLSGSATDATGTLSWEATALPADWTATLVDRQTGERYDVRTAGSAEVALGRADARTVTTADAGLSRAETQVLIDAAVDAAEPPPTPRSPEARALVVTASGAPRFALEIDPLGVLAGATVAEVSDVYPNPASHMARLEFRLPADAEVRVALFDVLGRRVASVLNGPLAAGVHVVDMPIGDLAPGTYLVRVDGTGLGVSRRLTVTR